MLDNQWAFGLGPMSETVVVKGYRISNDGHQVKLWCISGAGIALKSEFDVRDELASGQLMRLFDGYDPQRAPLQLLFPPNRRQPSRVKALSEFVAKAAKKNLHRVFGP